MKTLFASLLITLTLTTLCACKVNAQEASTSEVKQWNAGEIKCEAKVVMTAFGQKRLLSAKRDEVLTTGIVTQEANQYKARTVNTTTRQPVEENLLEPCLRALPD